MRKYLAPLFILLPLALSSVNMPSVPEFKRPGSPKLPQTPEGSKPVTKPTTPAQPAEGGATACMTAEEKKLLDLINDYRRGKGLPALTATRSMVKVAQTHANDLAENHPAFGACNMHSWSAKGNWSACCYTSDHAKAACMWKKPSELSTYKGNGFEISAGSSGDSIDAATALRVWQGSSAHNAVIINGGMWSRAWNAFGVGIYRGYAVGWFGNEADPAGAAAVCK
jgi:uncharacterized protein YkwD